MTTITILQVIPRLDTGGAELATLEITEAIGSAGGRALVATEGGRMAEAITELGGTLIPFPASTKRPDQILRNAFHLSSLIVKEGVNLIHARSRAPAWSALLAARRTSCPFVTTYHGAYGNKGPFKNAYNSVMARGDVVIANSRFTANLIQERHNPPEGRVRVIYRGVDLNKFCPESIDTQRISRLRSAWGVGSNERIVLHAARLTGWKGQQVVIDAAALLADNAVLDQILFILAGDAQGRENYVNALEAQIRKLGLDNRVRLVGHCDDIAAAFAVADFAVVASTEPEAFGRAAAEAQAVGCPVIVSDLGAVPETVQAVQYVSPEETTGWRVPPGNAGALAQALTEAVNLSKPARLAMGARARAHVMRHFSLERMKIETLAIYDELIGSRLVLQLKNANRPK